MYNDQCVAMFVIRIIIMVLMLQCKLVNLSVIAIATDSISLMVYNCAHIYKIVNDKLAMCTLIQWYNVTSIWIDVYIYTCVVQISVSV